MGSKKNLLMIIGLFAMVILISSEVAARNLAKTSSTSREAEIMNGQNGEGSVKHDNSTRLVRDDGHSLNYTVNTFDYGGGGDLPGGGGTPGGGEVPLPGRGLPPGTPMPPDDGGSGGGGGGGGGMSCGIFSFFGCGDWWPWTPGGGLPNEGAGGTPPGDGGYGGSGGGGIPSEGGEMPPPAGGGGYGYRGSHV